MLQASLVFAKPTKRPSEPESPANISVIVYVRHDLVPETVREFAQQVQTDEALNSELGFPVDARQTVRLPPLPNNIEVSLGSTREQLARYMTIDFLAGTDLDQKLSLLRRDDRFGYVSIDSDGNWSATPSDEFYVGLSSFEQQKWSYEQLYFDEAWDLTRGNTVIGLADTGVDLEHPDLTSNLRLHHSWNFAEDNSDVNDLGNSNRRYRGHGSHVLGLLAATTDNQIGVAGSCWDCSTMMARATKTSQRSEAFYWMLNNGSQVLNLSGFMNDVPAPCSNLPISERSPFCAVLEVVHDRDVVFVAASGNNLSSIDFPASDPRTIAAGGTQANGWIWDDRQTVYGCPTHDSLAQCGSNFGPEQDFVAPAKRVLSTFYTSFPWNPRFGCSDSLADPNILDPIGSTQTEGYDYCTGTSMSTAFIAGAFALARSSNPLLSMSQLKSAFVDTSSLGGNHDEHFGYGTPNVSEAVKRTLGWVGGNLLRNRLTPMFSLFSESAKDSLFTSKPQTASAAILGTLHELPTSSSIVPYIPRETASTIPNYPSFPMEQGIQSPTPTSSFHIFTTEHNPFDSQTQLVPLYRLSFAEQCDARNHVYTTEQAGIDYFTGRGTVQDFCDNQLGNQVFRLDSIEGYIFSSCPKGFTCDDHGDPAQPQCLNRLRNPHTGDWALVLDGEIERPPYTDYSDTVGNRCIGYVFSNNDSDSDGLIDGFELVLGTNPTDPDSDCDGSSDGAEALVFGLGGYGDPLSGPCAQCEPPLTGDWVINESCSVQARVFAPGDVVVESGVTLTIEEDASVDVDFANHKLLVRSEGQVLVKQGGVIE